MESGIARMVYASTGRMLADLGTKPQSVDMYSWMKARILNEVEMPEKEGVIPADNWETAAMLEPEFLWEQLAGSDERVYMIEDHGEEPGTL